MGLYLRKSVAVGPLRFNLSNSGIGVSAGVRGFRVGSGPRGNYIRIGRGLVRYQQTLPSPRLTVRTPPASPMPAIPFGTHGSMQEIASAGAAAIADSSSEELLAEIRDKKRLVPLTPFAIAAATLLFLFALALPAWAIVFAAAVGITGVVAARRRDIMRKTVVIVYDLDAAAEAAFDRFHEWASALAACRRTWHVDASARVYDRKYHAGAAQLVRRTATTLRHSPPPYVRTNVPVLNIAAGRKTLYFLPDRLLVYDGRDVGAVSYRSLELDVAKSRFIEDGPAPSDATVVDSTWQYVNRNGGPDRRFANNRQLPVCMYDELTFRTSSGLHEVVQVSRSGIGEGFAAAVRYLGNVA